MMNKIRLKTCQGVGDIFWVYQKFAPHFDKIDISIAQLEGGQGKLGTRAIEFLKIFPKIGNIDTHYVKEEGYRKLADNYFSMNHIITESKNGNNDAFDYACNRPLEDGIRIEDIDSEYIIEETVEMDCHPFPIPYGPQEYITLYVSGTTDDKFIRNRLKLWDCPTWMTFIRSFYKKYKFNLPIVLIGASYDQNVIIQMHRHLKRAGLESTYYIDSFPSNVVFILKNTKCFIGYQSGLNVLADNLDTKQVMLYFPNLKRMVYTWCKIANWKSGDFNASTFDLRPDQVLESLRLRF